MLNDAVLSALVGLGVPAALLRLAPSPALRGRARSVVEALFLELLRRDTGGEAGGGALCQAVSAALWPDAPPYAAAAAARVEGDEGSSSLSHALYVAVARMGDTEAAALPAVAEQARRCEARAEALAALLGAAEAADAAAGRVFAGALKCYFTGGGGAAATLGGVLAGALAEAIPERIVGGGGGFHLLDAVEGFVGRRLARLEGGEGGGELEGSMVMALQVLQLFLLNPAGEERSEEEEDRQRRLAGPLQRLAELESSAELYALAIDCRISIAQRGEGGGGGVGVADESGAPEGDRPILSALSAAEADLLSLLPPIRAKGCVRVGDALDAARRAGGAVALEASADADRAALRILALLDDDESYVALAAARALMAAADFSPLSVVPLLCRQYAAHLPKARGGGSIEPPCARPGLRAVAARLRVGQALMLACRRRGGAAARVAPLAARTFLLGAGTAFSEEGVARAVLGACGADLESAEAMAACRVQWGTFRASCLSCLAELSALLPLEGEGIAKEALRAAGAALLVEAPSAAAIAALSDRNAGRAFVDAAKVPEKVAVRRAAAYLARALLERAAEDLEGIDAPAAAPEVRIDAAFLREARGAPRAAPPAAVRAAEELRPRLEAAAAAFTGREGPGAGEPDAVTRVHASRALEAAGRILEAWVRGAGAAEALVV